MKKREDARWKYLLLVCHTFYLYVIPVCTGMTIYMGKR